MTDATTLGGVRPPGARVQLEFPLTRENLTAAFRKALNWNRPFADGPDDARAAGRRAPSPGLPAASSARCCGRLRRRS